MGIAVFVGAQIKSLSLVQIEEFGENKSYVLNIKEVLFNLKIKFLRIICGSGWNLHILF